jgi:hypothetical protein
VVITTLLQQQATANEIGHLTFVQNLSTVLANVKTEFIGDESFYPETDASNSYK